MDITKIIDKEKDLSEEEVADLVSYNTTHFSNLYSNLCRTLPLLVKYLSKQAKRERKAIRLSEFYPQQLHTLDRSTIKNYEVCYEANERGISLVAYDPASDTIDSGDSYEQDISTEEFLTWVMKDTRHMVDVYKHIRVSLHERERAADESHKQHLENYI